MSERVLGPAIGHGFIGPLLTDVPKIRIYGCARNILQRFDSEIHFKESETFIHHAIMHFRCELVGII